MKRTIKIFLITLLSLLILIIAAASIVVWIVFTPSKLTPIVKNQADKFIICQYEIGEVELTFFSTFPKFGLKVNRLLLVNAMINAPNDTLLNIDELVAIVDFDAWRKRKEVIINEISLNNGSINIFIDSLGNANYDIFVTDTASTATSGSASMPDFIGIEHVGIRNVDLSYVDIPLQVNAELKNTLANIEGTIIDNTFSSIIDLKHAIVSVDYANDQYLINTKSKFNIHSDIDLGNFNMYFKQIKGEMNALAIDVSGEITDSIKLDYKLFESPIELVMNMVPPIFHEYFEGIEAEGMLEVEGSLIGSVTGTEMPMNYVNLKLKNGTLNYSELPVPLEAINGSIYIVTDGFTDELSYMEIKHFEAKTGHSAFSTKGMVQALFSDIKCNLSINASLVLDEFNQFIPSEYKMNMKGQARGDVNALFTLSQIEKLELDKMKISGAINLTEFDLAYDTIFVSTNRGRINFAVPNRVPESDKTGFAYVRIIADKLNGNITGMLDASLVNSIFIVETSNVMDSTRIPDVICSFRVDTLLVSMDTISVSLVQPIGKAWVYPRADRPAEPEIKLVYSNSKLDAKIGNNTSEINTFFLNTHIINDNSKSDIFEQWFASGSIGLEQAVISLNGINVPIEIPEIELEFEPEMLEIKAGRVILGDSDFDLKGIITNMLSYYKGDSLLRGNLAFNSNYTDVTQLMGLTSGIGYEEETEIVTADTVYTGPYMVPKGLDITLDANIGQAAYGGSVADSIRGKVRVYDGIMLLDNVTLIAPAARMRLTAMYRTPRKNHLFLGLNYHMLDIEIEELLRMVPDIDTLMPMLRSFSGKGEFHLAVETYLDSMYNIKKSTLRGASSITGQNLVLMDGETFSEIAKTLRFTKQAQNRVDSLSAEFTIFREEIDVYPFLIVMDKYKAVVGGRHNFDLSFDYHISVVESPLPFRLGIDVKGNMDDMKYGLARVRYAEFYRPVSRGMVENRQLELRRMIREALTQGIE